MTSIELDFDVNEEDNLLPTLLQTNSNEVEVEVDQLSNDSNNNNNNNNNNGLLELDELIGIHQQSKDSSEFQDTSQYFDPLNTRYQNKEVFIKLANEQSERQGFRLWIGEGRPVKDQIAGQRVELACYKFRHKNEQGKRTRVGGCRFVLKAIQVPDMFDEDGKHQWELVGGYYTHNHTLGKLKPPRRPNAPRDPNAPVKEPRPPKKPKIKGGAAAAIDVSEVDQIIDDGYPAGIFDVNSWPSLLPNYSSSVGDIDVGSEALNNAILAANHQNHLDLTLHNNALASSSSNGFPMDPELDTPLHNSTAATNAADMLLLQQLSASLPALPHHTFMLHQPDTFGSISVADFLREQNPDLEQYADAFRNAGCTDLGSLLRLPEKDVRDFIDDDLPKLCPELVVRPFHRRLLLTVISDYRAIKSIAESVAATSTGVLEGLGGLDGLGDLEEAVTTEEHIAMMGLQVGLEEVVRRFKTEEGDIDLSLEEYEQ